MYIEKVRCKFSCNALTSDIGSDDSLNANYTIYRFISQKNSNLYPRLLN